MPVQTPFRITPSLGPDLHQSETQFHWDMVSDPNGDGDASYQPGSTVVGNDGYTYTFVQAGAAFDADDGLSVNTTTWVATADASSPVFEAPVAVADGEWFHARRIETFTSA